MAKHQRQKLLRELQEHISEAQQDSEIALDEHLFNIAGVALPNSLSKTEKDELLPALLLALFTLSQDPSPLCKLVLRLIEDYTFDEVVGLGPDLSLAQGLHLSATYYHDLTLSILDKAAASVSSAESIAQQGPILKALILLMLAGPEINVAEHARTTLLGLLRADKVHRDNTGATDLSGGQGLMWKRIFQDSEVYTTFFSCTSWTEEEEEDLTNRQRTIAQSRLLRFVEELLWLDWQWLCRSHDETIENKYGSVGIEGWGPSLLDYTTLHMVRWESDDTGILGDFLTLLTNLAHSAVAHQPSGYVSLHNLCAQY